MPTLQLVIFKTLLPQKAAHWGLLLLNGGADPNCLGTLYAVKKTSFTSKKTEFTREAYTPQLQKSVDTESLDIEVAHFDLSRTCTEVTYNRPFDLLHRNCQHWVYEVVELLVKRLNIVGGDEVLEKIRNFPQMARRD
jgi:hypothetical protein